MRKQLFLNVSACFLLPCFLYSCQTTHKAVSQTLAANTDSVRPAFINGVSLHKGDRKKVYTHVARHKRTSAKVAAAPYNQPDKEHVPEINTMGEPVIVSQFSPGVNDGMATAGKKIDSVDNIEPAGVAVKKSGVPELKDGKVQAIEEKSNAKTAELNAIAEETIDPMIVKYAEIISVSAHDITNYPLYHFIDDWYGTEYKWGGTDSAGIDCSAFSQKLYGEIYGIDILRTAREQHRNSERIRRYSDAAEGDLIFFRIHRLRISHVGVYLSNGFFVHASSSQGVVISNINDRYWRRRYAGCGKVARDDGPVAESDNNMQ